MCTGIQFLNINYWASAHQAWSFDLVRRYSRCVGGAWHPFLQPFSLRGKAFCTLLSVVGFTRRASVGLPTNRSSHQTRRLPFSALGRISRNALVASRVPPAVSHEGGTFWGVPRSRLLSLLPSKSRNTKLPWSTLPGRSRVLPISGRM